jgi:AcrR family transcriptional regulator
MPRDRGKDRGRGRAEKSVGGTSDRDHEDSARDETQGGMVVNRSSRRQQKSTQRERILEGMIGAVAEHGYARASIAEVISRAGVSRPTFYEYFTDKNDCFVETLRTIRDELVADATETLDAGEAARAIYAAVELLTTFASSQPARARVMLSDAMGAGEAALDVRDDSLVALARLVDERYCSTPEAAAPDVPPRPLLGGVYRTLASHLRLKASFPVEFSAELGEWLDRYQAPISEHQWRQLLPVACQAPALIAEQPLEETSARAPGRRHASRRTPRQDYQRRILLAAARLVTENGAAATTINDLMRGAGIDSRIFYGLFKSKHEVFRTLHELLFRRVLAATAGGFAAADVWPAKVWEAARTFARYVQQQPGLSQATFVDSFTCDVAVVERVEQLVNSFTIFLQEGFTYQGTKTPPPAASLPAIAATLFELGYMHVRENRLAELSGVVPHATFICLGPFIGVEASNELINAMLDEQRSPDTAPRERAETLTVAR